MNQNFQIRHESKHYRPCNQYKHRFHCSHHRSLLGGRSVNLYILTTTTYILNLMTLTTFELLPKRSKCNFPFQILCWLPTSRKQVLLLRLQFLQIFFRKMTGWLSPSLSTIWKNVSIWVNQSIKTTYFCTLLGLALCANLQIWLDGGDIFPVVKIKYE